VSSQADLMDRIAGQVREALEAADLDGYADLLDDGARWGAPGDPVPPCRSRAQVLAWYRRGRDAGTRARVTETLVAGDKILVGLKVTGPADAPTEAGEADRWQVLTVRGGRVAEITGFSDRNDAAAWAGLTPPRPAAPGSIRWAAPAELLADDQISLRLPEPADAGVLHGYASRDGGLDGSWAPLPSDATLADCRAMVDDWLAGWRNERSFNGPALIITSASEPELAGLVGLIDCGGRVAELSYGIAPDRRGRGYASSAARLAARWLLHDRHADLVELRIDPANTASQRAALAAGFSPAGTVHSHADSTGEGDDLRFVMRLEREADQSSGR
jgi:RimJ/RimL family protein N-acetyltransferase/ketosteroid isomerase-like protein